MTVVNAPRNREGRIGTVQDPLSAQSRGAVERRPDHVKEEIRN
jgi:hypothetical protein